MNAALDPHQLGRALKSIQRRLESEDVDLEVLHCQINFSATAIEENLRRIHEFLNSMD